MGRESRVCAWAETNVGNVRKRNEDAFLMLPEKSFYLVADGMGGHKRGDLASQMCGKSVNEFLTGTGKGKTVAFFRSLLDKPFDERAVWERTICAAIEFANRRIARVAASSPELAGMGTTVVSAGFRQDTMFTTWCGDSRLYCFRDAELQQVTEDHSLVNQYLKSGVLTPEQARRFPHRNVILQALGLSDEFSYDWLQWTTRPGDVYLLCSDGLNDMLADDGICAILKENVGTEESDDDLDNSPVEDEACRKVLSRACDSLINAALESGGMDNVTVLLVRVLPDAD